MFTERCEMMNIFTLSLLIFKVDFSLSADDLALVTLITPAATKAKVH